MTYLTFKTSSFIFISLFSSLSFAQSLGTPATTPNDFFQMEFKNLDTNADGKISPDEFLANKRKAWTLYSQNETMSIESCAQSMVNLSIASAQNQDVNNDPILLDISKKYCQKLATVHDGKITWNDYAHDVWTQFKILDKNHDGFLSFDEFSSPVTPFLKKGPQPQAPSPQLEAKMRADLAQSNAQIKAPRTAAQINTSSPNGQSGMNSSTDRLTQLRLNSSKPRTQPVLPQTVDRPATNDTPNIAERIQNWLK